MTTHGPFDVAQDIFAPLREIFCFLVPALRTKIDRELTALAHSPSNQYQQYEQDTGLAAISPVRRNYIVRSV